MRATPEQTKLNEALQALKSYPQLAGKRYECALILGSGLDALFELIEDPFCVDYAAVPHMPQPSAPGHAGIFAFGHINTTNVVCMRGRVHLYEGYTAKTLSFGVRVMHALGAKTLMLTNSAGAINPAFSVGDLMLINDHINFLGTNPCIGQQERFFDMSHAYTPHLRKKALSAARTLGIQLQQGVYLACSGPSFETPAEIRAFATLGADAVGMSTVPETIVARALNMEIIAFSVISNIAADLDEAPINASEINQVSHSATDKLAKLFAFLLS